MGRGFVKISAAMPSCLDNTPDTKVLYAYMFFNDTYNFESFLYRTDCPRKKLLEIFAVDEDPPILED